MRSQKANKRFGYLKSCMDKRFVAKTRGAFEKATGLRPDEYWHEAIPGGAALEGETTGEDYATNHGATILGWQGHINVCGGQPNVDDETIVKRLDANVDKKTKKFPNAQHYRLLASEKGVDVKRVK